MNGFIQKHLSGMFPNRREGYGKCQNGEQKKSRLFESAFFCSVVDYLLTTKRDTFLKSPESTSIEYIPEARLEMSRV
jgi:hypothetical protein